MKKVFIKAFKFITFPFVMPVILIFWIFTTLFVYFRVFFVEDLDMIDECTEETQSDFRKHIEHYLKRVSEPLSKAKVVYPCAVLFWGSIYLSWIN